LCHRLKPWFTFLVGNRDGRPHDARPGHYPARKQGIG
jgi:hypothetical protein